MHIKESFGCIARENAGPGVLLRGLSRKGPARHVRYLPRRIQPVNHNGANSCAYLHALLCKCMHQVFCSQKLSYMCDKRANGQWKLTSSPSLRNRKPVDLICDWCTNTVPREQHDIGVSGKEENGHKWALMWISHCLDWPSWWSSVSVRVMKPYPFVMLNHLTLPVAKARAQLCRGTIDDARVKSTLVDESILAVWLDRMGVNRALDKWHAHTTSHATLTVWPRGVLKRVF